MKSIILILLLITCGSIPFTSADSYRCEKLKFGTLEIKNNPFVKPGNRANKTVWYDSVTWERIPPGQVQVTTEFIIHRWGQKSYLRGRHPFDLFAAYDSREMDGSFANFMRMALGIPRFSDPVLGERKLDPLLFSPKPCTVFYTNFLHYESEHQFTFDFHVYAKDGGKDHTIVKGTLIKPDE